MTAWALLALFKMALPTTVRAFLDRTSNAQALIEPNCRSYLHYGTCSTYNSFLDTLLVAPESGKNMENIPLKQGREGTSLTMEETAAVNGEKKASWLVLVCSENFPLINAQFSIPERRFSFPKSLHSATSIYTEMRKRVISTSMHHSLRSLQVVFF